MSHRLGSDTPAAAKLEKLLASIRRGPGRRVKRDGALVHVSVPARTSLDDEKGLEAAEKLATDVRAAVNIARELSRRAILKRPLPVPAKYR
ncbi:MAG: hypothetical protein JST54_03885 [Deltaproteobacteria bacterium]|nr:hypothetical protein [Deltaproteobacteria bacterium]